MTDYVNLELKINTDDWKVILLTDKKTESYYMVDLTNKTLYIHGTDIDKTKKMVWQNYHEEYKENYI